MKKILLLTYLILLLCPLSGYSSTTDVRINLWTGEVSTGNWSKYLMLTSDYFTNATVGDELIISVSAIDASIEWQQLMLNDTQNWNTLVDTDSEPLWNKTAPCEVSIYISAPMLAEIKANGVVIKGSGFTMTSVDLNKKASIGGGDKGEAFSTIWTGSELISWTAPTNWVTLASSKFSDAKVGDIVRFNFSNIKMGAQGHICNAADWSNIETATDYVQLSAAYFQFTITNELLSVMQESGLIVTGYNYTLTSVDIIDPAKRLTIIAQAEKSDIKVWEANESPIFRTTITNLNSMEITIPVTLILRTDDYETENIVREEITLASGESKTVSFDLSLVPGFYHLVSTVDGEIVADSNIGYNPTAIVSAPDYQNDFDQFWEQGLSQLGNIDGDYKLTLISEQSTTQRNVYLVEMQSVPDDNGNSVTIRGYYAEPVGGESYPAIITYQGYDSNTTSTPYCPNGDSNPEWIEFVLSTRGQVINNRPPYENIYGDWFTYNFGNKNNYYYRGAYLDAVRAIDFVASRDKVQKNNIFAQGQSQGGAFTIAAAALDDRLNAIAPSIQFMGDFPNYFRVGNWPGYIAFQKQKEEGLTDEQMYAFLSYFDTKNLATKITCPLITSIGLQDAVCPPRTNFAPYNNLPDNVEKSFIINNDLQHQVSSSWYNDYMTFFNAKLKLLNTEVNSVQATSPVKVSVKNGEIHISGNENNEKIEIYSLCGRIVYSGIDSTIMLNTNGIYVLKIKDTVYKVCI